MTFISEVKNSETDAATIRRFTLPRVLVVDDDDCLLQTVQQMVEALGFKADAANGGLAAMRCLSRASYDLMVTDLQMPDTKIAVMTGGDADIAKELLNDGTANFLFMKPFSVSSVCKFLIPEAQMA